MSDHLTLSIRAYEPDDLPALVEVINRAVEHDGEDGHTTLDALRSRFDRPYFYPQDNCLIASTADSPIVGYCVADLDPRVGMGWGDGHIDPAFRRRGIGRRLLQAADARHRERGAAEVAPHLPLTVTRYCRDTNAGTVALLGSEGYEIVRISWFMRIDLDTPVDAPPLPDGIALRPFDRHRDAYAVFEAEQDIFRDNWGRIQPPYDVWQNLMFGPHHDSALWLVAVDGDEIAGLCLCRPKGDDATETGWVDTLGVRQMWRRRGLGSALLRTGFRALQQRGFAIAELEVDSENVSNAVALYERAGMEVARRYLIWRKTLREGQVISPE